VTSSPSNCTEPLRGDTMPRIVFNVVDLPDALPPSRQTSSPGSIRIESFWIDTWLRSNYKGLETRYIIHDAVAREVDRETFFHTRESGGTMISSAYKLCKEMMEADYDTGSWNIYPFHFSDGDNWSADDTRTCVTLLKADVLPKVNQFAYGQVESPYGSGQFIKDLREAFDSVENVALSEIANKDAIYNSIKDFLGKGS